MVIKVDSITLVPLLGKKLKLKGSRHFAISKRHPQSKKISEFLEKGVAELRENGLIEKAYRESGFFHKDVEGWELLN